MAANAAAREDGVVELGKVSMIESGEVSWRLDLMDCKDSGRRASRATAMLPWDGWERMRAIPVPLRWDQYINGIKLEIPRNVRTWDGAMQSYAKSRELKHTYSAQHR